MANNLCHLYNKDKRQQTGFCSCSSAQVEMGEEKASEERGCKISLLASKLLPSARAKPHAPQTLVPMEKAAVPERGGLPSLQREGTSTSCLFPCLASALETEETGRSSLPIAGPKATLSLLS